MEISYQWLKAFLPNLPEPQMVADKLTACGLEVESISTLLPVPGGLEGVVTGMVLDAQKHPDADKLSICQVEVGAEQPFQIVCGAPNVAAGQCVLVALPGTTLHPKEGEPFKIKKSKIRGAESNGMICADDEIGLGSDHSGIRVLEAQFAPGTPAAQALNLLPDYVFSIGLTPNRADAASHFGVARDLSVLLNQALQFPDTIQKLQPVGVQQAPAVKIDTPEACGIYTLQRMERIQMQPSPENIQNKLRAVGANPMNAVVDLTNYFLLGYGQPMHAFDADKVKGSVVVRYARNGEKFISLSGEELSLVESDLVIADESGPIALAGVIGGKETAVSDSTQNILLETAWFHPDAVRKTARNHQLHTEASFRFSRGIDPLSVEKFKDMALGLYTTICSAQVSGNTQTAIGILPNPVSLTLTIKDFYRLAGIQIPEGEIVSILTGLEIRSQKIGEGVYELVIPPYRVDVTRPQDVYEDILRIYGYDQVAVSGRMPSAPVFPLADREIYLRNLLGDMLASKGYYEILTNSLVSRAAAGESGVQMKNPLSEEHAALRSSMLPSGLEVLAFNKNRKANDLRFFEFGKTYAGVDKDFSESLKLGIWLAGNRSEEHWQVKPSEVEIFTLSSLVDWLTSGLQQATTKIEYSDSELAWGFQLMVGKEILGRYGRVRNEFTSAADFNGPVYYLELDWKRVYKAIGRNVPEFKELPKYPAVRRDLSLLIPPGLTWKKLQDCIYSADPGLIRAVEVFDVYTSKQEEGSKTSYSVSIILQDFQNTLQEARITKVMEKIIKLVEEQTGAVMRD